MTRLSLSPEPEEWQQGRFRLRDDELDASDEDSQPGSFIEDSDTDDDDDYPHPMGFPGHVHSSWGKTRFSLDATMTPESIEHQWENFSLFSPGKIQQRYPPLGSYINARTAPTSSLIRYNSHSDRRHRMQQIEDSEMDHITQLLQAASVVDQRRILAPSTQQPVVNQTPLALLAATASDIQQQLQVERNQMEQEHMEATQALQMLLQKNQDKADKLLQEEKRREREENERQEAENERARRQEDKKAAEEAELQKQQQIKQKKEADWAKQAQEKIDQEKAQEAAKYEYVVKAKKLVLQLQQLRASIEPFETSKAVGKRRLNMKKVVRGKVNTLAENAEKIKSVASDVGNAIAQARAEDEDLKKQIQAGNTQIPQEVTRGKRYMVDLLCSSIMVRVQAEGFNGLRGDGFPIASMMAILSVDNKEVVPIMAAHIYTVCPTAIPKLPKPSSEASEEALMKSLGMSKDKKGEYETFDRFLTRTEGIISLVADIMASNPANHQLLGGHKGAIDWLERFLGLLPEAPQSPLPLLTAPVLDGFLTGAGHMLANVHPDEFKTHLDFIINDVVNRLDEGSIGQPSATRLKKTIKDGFDGFKNNLPHKALPELYYGAGGSGLGAMPSGGLALATSTSASNSNPFGGAASGGASTSVPNPFGVPSQGAKSDPFGSASNSGASQNPFGGVAASSASPFGTNQTPTPTPFGGSSAASSASNPFGGSISGMSNQNAMNNGIENSMQDDPFSIQQSGGFGMASTPFGGAQSNNTGLASTPFGGSSNAGSAFGGSNAASNPSPFGQKPPLSSSSTPFGNPGNFGGNSNAASAFGGKSAGSNPSPFGQSANSMASPSPFKGSAGASHPSPFGQTLNAASNPSPFGQPSNAASNPSPFGQPANAASNPSPFGQPANAASNPSPFGQPANTMLSSSPFGKPPVYGGSTNSSPFGGGNNASTPFSGNRGGGGGGSPFGGRGGGGGFGGGNSGQSGNKPPCKFFARGQCKFGANCRFSHGN